MLPEKNVDVPICITDNYQIHVYNCETNPIPIDRGRFFWTFCNKASIFCFNDEIIETNWYHQYLSNVLVHPLYLLKRAFTFCCLLNPLHLPTYGTHFAMRTFVLSNKVTLQIQRTFSVYSINTNSPLVSVPTIF